MAVKMKIMFDGFKDLAADIDRAGGDVQAAVNEALVETQSLIQQNLTTAAAPYSAKGRKGYATGAMYGTIISDGAVSWAGTIATVNTGFRIRQNGGWHSIFVMYGTPRMSKDSAVFNAIKGSATAAQIAQKQQEIMMEHLKL